MKGAGGIDLALEEVGGSGGRGFRVRIPEEFPAFAGHFPGRPVLPAIAQIALVLQAAERLLGRRADLSALPSVRLRAPVLPGDRLELRLDPPDTTGRLRFEMRRGEAVASSGTLVLGQGDPL